MWSRIKVRWPLLIWLLSVVGFLAIWKDLGAKLIFSGVVTTRSHPIITIEPARVAKVHVVNGQQVAAGDVVAELDTSVLQGEIDAEVQAQAETIAEHKLEIARAERTFQQVVFEAEVDLRDLAIQRAAEQAELASIQQELDRLKPLVERNLADPLSVAGLRARADALTKGLEQYPAAEKARADYMDWARKALAASQAENAVAPDPNNAPAARALRARLPLFTLSAPVAGVITNVTVSAGEGVREGDTLVTLVENTSGLISGFLHEDMVNDVKVGQDLWAFVDPLEKEYVPVKVSALGPNIIDIPTAQSLFPGRMIRGRPVLLEIQGAHTLLPGQRVTMRSSVPWWVKHGQKFIR